MRKLRIGNRVITEDSQPYVIAEIGNNHGGSITTCMEMIRAAKQCGADAVKLQKRDNETLYTKALLNQPYDNENSYGATYGEHRAFLEFNPDEYIVLFNYAKGLGIDFFATAFDIPSADILYELRIPVFKIASGGLTNLELITRVSDFKKPMIISTGGGTYDDMARVYAILVGRTEFAFLHCVASYPNKPHELNLESILSLQYGFPEILIGYSNHHPSVKMCLVAALKGAKIIETHFTLNRGWKGTDHGFSLEPKGLETLCTDLKDIHVAIGNGIKVKLESEEKPLNKMAQSVHIVKPVKAGDILTRENTALKTPADGVPAYQYEEVLGKSILFDLSTGDTLEEDMYE